MSQFRFLRKQFQVSERERINQNSVGDHEKECRNFLPARCIEHELIEWERRHGESLYRPDKPVEKNSAANHYGIQDKPTSAQLLTSKEENKRGNQPENNYFDKEHPDAERLVYIIAHRRQAVRWRGYVEPVNCVDAFQQDIKNEKGAGDLSEKSENFIFDEMLLADF